MPFENIIKINEDIFDLQYPTNLTFLTFNEPPIQFIDDTFFKYKNVELVLAFTNFEENIYGEYIFKKHGCYVVREKVIKGTIFGVDYDNEKIMNSYKDFINYYNFEIDFGW